MAQRFWTGTIGGISLVDSADGQSCGFEITGAGAWLNANNWTGNAQAAASGKRRTQYSLINDGRILEIKFLHIPAALAAELIEALTDLDVIPDENPVACEFQDGFQTIEADFLPAVPDWLDRGEPDGDYIIDFIIRLAEAA